MQAEKYTVTGEVIQNKAPGRPDFDQRVFTVQPAESGELPDGVDAVLLVRSGMSRPEMQNALLELQDKAFGRTWPPTDPQGGDKALTA